MQNQSQAKFRLTVYTYILEKEIDDLLSNQNFCLRFMLV